MDFFRKGACVYNFLEKTNFVQTLCGNMIKKNVTKKYISGCSNLLIPLPPSTGLASKVTGTKNGVAFLVYGITWNIQLSISRVFRKIFEVFDNLNRRRRPENFWRDSRRVSFSIKQMYLVERHVSFNVINFI